MEKYLKIVVWPIAFVAVAVVAILLNTDGTAIRELQLGKDGIKISYFLLTATEARETADQPAAVSAEEAATIARVASTAETLSLTGKRILWVDDNPSNNRYEADALAVLGISIDVARSTAEALTMLRAGSYDAIISDFRRDGDRDAGYGLLDRLQSEGFALPYIIYSGSVTPEYEAEAIARGALGETNRPSRLFELVVTAIQ